MRTDGASHWLRLGRAPQGRSTSPKTDAYCLAEGIDLAEAGILHREVAREAILNQAALLAASVAVRPDRFTELRRKLQTQQERDPGSLAALAVIRGFSVKWS